MQEVRDPADVRSVVGEATAVTAADVAAAYPLAGTAFARWRRTGPLDRGAVLARCAYPSKAGAAERAAPKPHFCASVKTSVRYQW